MSLARILCCALAIASITTLTGCPGKSTDSSAAAHDVKYYNTHAQERRATVERCGKLDQAAQDADENCKAAIYSSLYGPSQLNSPSPR